MKGSTGGDEARLLGLEVGTGRDELVLVGEVVREEDETRQRRREPRRLRRGQGQRR